jgi:signal transduction histidine kinase
VVKAGVVMIYVTMMLFLLILFLLARFYFLKKQLRSITVQMQENNQLKTEKKIDLSFFDKDIEALAVEINLQFERIVQANAERRRTENELKQAVANISHDLRTPLTSIFGYIQLLESASLSEAEKKKYILIIKNRTIRLRTLLSDFFELAVIESIDYQLGTQQIKMNELVSETLLSYYDHFRKRRLTPVISIPNEEIILISDESAVKRVLENLIMNAIQHSSGNIEIMLEKDPSSVMLTVKNEIDTHQELDLSLLFDRFYKADQIRSGKGTGLGLAITRSLMVKMGGEIFAKQIGNRLCMRCIWKIK